MRHQVHVEYHRLWITYNPRNKYLHQSRWIMLLQEFVQWTRILPYATMTRKRSACPTVLSNPPICADFQRDWVALLHAIRLSASITLTRIDSSLRLSSGLENYHSRPPLTVTL